MENYEPISKSMFDVLKDVEKPQENLKAIPTGFKDLDDLLSGGLPQRQLLLIGGRPEMGKTAFAINACFNIAQHLEFKKVQKSVVFLSFDLTRKEIAERILSNKCEIPSHNIRKCYVNEEQFDDLAAGVTLLNRVPFYVNDDVKNLNDIVRILNVLKKEGKEAKVICIDTLDDLLVSMKINNANITKEGILFELKRIAKEFNTTIIITSGLDKKLEERDNKRPHLSDLIDIDVPCSSIDVVMFLYRDIYYLQNVVLKRRKNETPECFSLRVAELEQKKLELYNKAEIIVDKNRHGPIGTIKLIFKGEFSKFDNLTKKNN